MIPIGPICFLLLLFIASSAVLTLVIAGRRDPARARCAGCRAELLPATIMRSEPCPVCHASLTGDRAIVTSRRQASRTAWVSFVVLVVLWTATLLFPYFLSRWAGPQGLATGGAATIPIDALVVEVVNESGGVSTASLEFSRRQQLGEVDVAAARKVLLAELAATDPATVTQSQPGSLVVAEAILSQNPEDTEVMDAILTAFQPTPSVSFTAAPSGRVGIQVKPSVRSTHAGRTLQPMMFVRRVLVGDRAIPFWSLRRSREPLTLMLISPAHDTLLVDERDIADAKELTVEFEAVLFDYFDSQRVGGVNWSGAEASDWPTPMRTQQRRVVLPLSGAKSP